jgi:hypothetical protein
MPLSKAILDAKYPAHVFIPYIHFTHLSAEPDPSWPFLDHYSWGVLPSLMLYLSPPPEGSQAQSWDQSSHASTPLTFHLLEFGE